MLVCSSICSTHVDDCYEYLMAVDAGDHDLDEFDQFDSGEHTQMALFQLFSGQ